MTKRQELEITVLSEILRFIRENSCNDTDDFASKLAGLYVECLSKTTHQFATKSQEVTTNFFRRNKVKRAIFMSNLEARLAKLKLVGPTDIVPLLRFVDIFPEIGDIDDSRVRSIDAQLKIAEEVIQTALRDALREKGASPIVRRGKDSVLEVADLEHFYMTVKDRQSSFSAVVKGYKSISAKRVSWEDIAHQITKAHRTKPDHILFLTAKEPKDSVLSEIVSYCADVQKPHLVIFVTPMDLAKFLIWRNILS